MSLISMQNTFNGVPFLHADFKHSLLIAAIIACRSSAIDRLGLAEYKNLGIANIFTPTVGHRLRRDEGKNTVIDFEDLSNQEQRLVEEQIRYITSIVPEWEFLFAIPISYKKLRNSDAISCSCYAYPQQIFLSDTAFISAHELAEQIIHESCHNWLYLVEEIEALYHVEKAGRFTLPSGTTGKNIGEVIGAAHVSAVLSRWYGALEQDDSIVGRRTYMKEYCQGCLQTLSTIEPAVLTVIGTEVISMISGELDRITAENNNVQNP